MNDEYELIIPTDTAPELEIPQDISSYDIDQNNGVYWGDISGSISRQTDLTNALNSKQNALTEAQLAAINSGITAERVASYNEKVKVVRNASGTLVFYKESLS